MYYLYTMRKLSESLCGGFLALLRAFFTPTQA